MHSISWVGVFWASHPRSVPYIYNSKAILKKLTKQLKKKNHVYLLIVKKMTVEIKCVSFLEVSSAIRQNSRVNEILKEEEKLLLQSITRSWFCESLLTPLHFSYNHFLVHYLLWEYVGCITTCSFLDFKYEKYRVMQYSYCTWAHPQYISWYPKLFQFPR